VSASNHYPIRQLMAARPPPFLTAEQCLEKEAECRHMGTLASLTPRRRVELIKMADEWARLAKIAKA
jgi:hypothetical protein